MFISFTVNIAIVVLGLLSLFTNPFKKSVMEKTALFPGSFDPFTIGHESIVRRALPLFDKIIIAVGHNTNKKSLFSIDERVYFIQMVFEGIPKIDILPFKGLTVDLCKKLNANYILRGLRTSADFEYERTIGQMNHAMHPEIETVFFLTQPEHTHITSTIVRDVIIHGGDPSIFLPEKIVIKR